MYFRKKITISREIMITDIYKVLRNYGFASKNQDVENNKRLGIKRMFTKDNKHRVEIYQENGYYMLLFSSVVFCIRSVWIDIVDSNDLNELKEFLESKI